MTTNRVELVGTLTNDVYTSPKGWAGATLAVGKAGTTYKTWVRLYAPAGVDLKGKKEDSLRIIGEIDEGKDKDGNKVLQVKVSKVTPVDKDADVLIDSEDFPF